MTPLLENYYWTMVMQHAPSGFVSRIPLLLFLYLVATGNERPGRRFLTIVFAAHFGLSALMGAAVGGEVRLIALLSAALFGVCGWYSWREETAWKVLPDGSVLRTLAIIGYTIAFIYPFWRFLSWWAGPFFSPMGVLPHQSLLALLVLLAVTGRAAPRPLVYTAIICSLVLAAVDLALTTQPWAVVVALAGLVALVVSLLPTGQATVEGGDSAQEAAPPSKGTGDAEKPAGKAPPAARPPKGKPGRKWDLR